MIIEYEASIDEIDTALQGKKGKPLKVLFHSLFYLGIFINILLIPSLWLLKTWLPFIPIWWTVLVLNIIFVLVVSGIHIVADFQMKRHKKKFAEERSTVNKYKLEVSHFGVRQWSNGEQMEWSWDDIKSIRQTETWTFFITKNNLVSPLKTDGLPNQDWDRLNQILNEQEINIGTIS